MLDVNSLVPPRNVLLMTLDTLRYDVAVEQFELGHTPNLANLLPSGWEARHTPGSFTYAAHHAFFACFLPTPIAPGPHTRPFALAFAGSETIGAETRLLEGRSLPEGLAALGYRTICIGGVGFFNPSAPLGSVLPGMFHEHHWSSALGVTEPGSTQYQVELAARLLGRYRSRRIFLFINVSAIHQPNRHYIPGQARDDRASHAAALAYVDGQLQPLFEAMTGAGDWLCILTSDHGTCYGEDGYNGHRLAHPVVWTVPYAEFTFP